MIWSLWTVCHPPPGARRGVQGWQDMLGSTPDLSLLPPWDKHSSFTAQDLVSSHVQLHKVLTSFRLQFLVNL